MPCLHDRADFARSPDLGRGSHAFHGIGTLQSGDPSAGLAGFGVYGVGLLTDPWSGAINPSGIAFAGLPVVSWEGLHLLANPAADRFSGVPRILPAIAAVTIADSTKRGFSAWPGAPWAIVAVERQTRVGSGSASPPWLPGWLKSK